MNLYVVAKTSIKDLVIDFIEIINEKGQTISLNWEESSITRVKDGFNACYDCVIFNEETEACMDILSEMRVVHVELYSETKKRLDIDIKEMGFVDDNWPSAFVVEDCYFTVNHQSTVKFLNRLERFLRNWMKKYHYDIKKYFSFDDTSEVSGLYDIAYDMKADIERSSLNPYSKKERTGIAYAEAFDGWYDCLIVESIVPFLRRLANEEQERANGADV